MSAVDLEELEEGEIAESDSAEEEKVLVDDSFYCR